MLYVYIQLKKYIFAVTRKNITLKLIYNPF